MSTERHPLGIMPEFMWKEIRLKQIDNAVDRYEAAGKPIPKEWADEREKLTEWLNDYEGEKKIKIVDIEFENSDKRWLKLFFNKRLPTNIYKTIMDAVESVLNDEQPKEGTVEYSEKYIQEQKPSRDWEILKGVDPRNGEVHTWVKEDDCSRITNCVTNGCKIHSVKRLADGEVFSVGDETIYGVINKFKIDGNGWMDVHFDDGCGTALRALKRKPPPLTYDYVTKERCNELRKLAFEAAKMFSGSGSCSPKYYSFEDYDKDCNIK